jgi:hypothetical protein
MFYVCEVMQTGKEQLQRGLRSNYESHAQTFGLKAPKKCANIHTKVAITQECV